MNSPNESPPSIIERINKILNNKLIITKAVKWLVKPIISKGKITVLKCKTGFQVEVEKDCPMYHRDMVLIAKLDNKGNVLEFNLIGASMGKNNEETIDAVLNELEKP
ncbi:MAG: hypothetical protein P1V18_03210 [Candidatus Gracilibacteria bacterium]|nr:hypothetical protein [Candidatus Gracilibacteria bacterium]